MKTLGSSAIMSLMEINSSGTLFLELKILFGFFPFFRVKSACPEFPFSWGRDNNIYINKKIYF